MPNFLLRDDAEPLGYKESPTLPRVQGYDLRKRVEGQSLPIRMESYVPWALTADGRVVYALYGAHRSKPNRPGWLPYDPVTSQSRRRMCESALGMVALTQRDFTRAAVNEVSFRLKFCIAKNYFNDPAKLEEFFLKYVGKYLYSDTGFGRLGTTAPKSARAVYEAAMEVLRAPNSSPLPATMAVHDAIGIKVIGGERLERGDRGLQWPEGVTWREHWDELRPANIFGDDVRGRLDREDPKRLDKIKVPAVQTPGTVPTGVTHNLGTVDQSRKRGVDKFERDLPKTQKPGQPLAVPAYYSDLDDRNLLFGAGPSGTTGTLLATGLTFGLDGQPELLKQYTLAIIGYLIGGGMHSLHESLVAAKLAGVPYPCPGGFLDWLPNSFLTSRQFRAWNDEFYDIVTLGSIHWMHNQRDGALPQGKISVKEMAASFGTTLLTGRNKP